MVDDPAASMQLEAHPSGKNSSTIDSDVAIIRKRFAMWEKVSSRSHKPAKIYAFGPDGDDVMLYGTVDYTLKDGKSAKGIDWSARAHFVQDGGKPKMDFYQVYLVRQSIPMRNHD